MWLFLLGLLLAFGGVGGIETSLNDWQLAGSFLISLGGLLLMFAGTILMKLQQQER